MTKKINFENAKVGDRFYLSCFVDFFYGLEHNETNGVIDVIYKDIKVIVFKADDGNVLMFTYIGEDLHLLYSSKLNSTREKKERQEIDTTTFENAKVGDRVYCSHFISEGKTNGIINSINDSFICSINVRLDSTGENVSFTKKGKPGVLDIYEQALFWEKPKFEIPKKPIGIC